jgi:hypothetical protein
MIINSTNILRDSNYLNNTENVAMVHVRRVVDAGDGIVDESEFTIYTPFKVKIEELTNIRNVIFEVRGPTNNLIHILPVINIVGNEITFTDNGVSFVNAINNQFTIIAFGV